MSQTMNDSAGTKKTYSLILKYLQEWQKNGPIRNFDWVHASLEQIGFPKHLIL